LILMPEIALSNSFIRRFADRFGVKPALWHSSLTPAQRRLTWRSIVTGQTKVVVGARSALFLPYADLQLIVVDEEHDPAFKQEEVTIYNARDMAVVRAHQGKIPVVLASATPSLETMYNAWEGRYTLLTLPDRYGGASKPEIKIIDLRVDKPERQHFMSPVLIDEVQKTLDAKQQALLFLNRRGFAPLTLCRTCGHRMECPKCTSWLVEHRRTNHLQCHHCGFSVRIPLECPSCHDKESLVACGPGVERIAEEVKEYFPTARSLILASDITDTHDKLISALDAIKNGDVDIIIGTQIIAKGHHFPQITCVGIIDADLGLSGGDLRATERSYQLLHQVAGRAGREHLKGRVFLQTYNAEQRVMQMIAADDRDSFLEAEAGERQRAKMPPFSRLAALIITGKNEAQAKDIAQMIGRAAPHVEGVQILGPAPAQMYRIRGAYRQRLLIRAEKNLNIQKLIAEWLGGLKIPSAVRIQIDIDPQNFL
jgi:primosomal protein N' (replication factor Y)